MLTLHPGQTIEPPTWPRVYCTSWSHFGHLVFTTLPDKLRFVGMLNFTDTITAAFYVAFAKNRFTPGEGGGEATPTVEGMWHYLWANILNTGNAPSTASAASDQACASRSRRPVPRPPARLWRRPELPPPPARAGFL